MAQQTQTYESTVKIDGLIRRILDEGGVTPTDTSPSFICPRIREGIYIIKSMDFVEPKDDVLIFLDDFKCADGFLGQEDITMQTIIDYFDATKRTYALLNYQEREGRKIVPFSKIVHDGVGQCLEMALMSQLLFQKRDRTSFLCGGKINQDSFDAHAWNLIKTEDQYFIWDCALRLYAPLERAEICEGALFLHPNFEKSVGNKNMIIYQIGGD